MSNEHTVKSYEEELQFLKDSLIKMGSLTESQLSDAMDAVIKVDKDSIDKNEKVVIIDDLIATGGTAEAAAKIIEMSGGKVSNFLFPFTGCSYFLLP